VPKRGDEGSGCSVARVSRTHSRHPPLHQAGGPSFRAVCDRVGILKSKRNEIFALIFTPHGGSPTLMANPRAFA
jgi:hypothetical protein